MNSQMIKIFFFFLNIGFFSPPAAKRRTPEIKNTLSPVLMIIIDFHFIENEMLSNYSKHMYFQATSEPGCKKNLSHVCAEELFKPQDNYK